MASNIPRETSDLKSSVKKSGVRDPNTFDQSSWIRDLAEKAGQSPEQLLFMLQKSPKNFIDLAVRHGFRPPPVPAKKPVERNALGLPKVVETGKYRVPSIGEMITKFGQGEEAAPAPTSTPKPVDPWAGQHYKSGWDQLVELFSPGHYRPGEKGAGSGDASYEDTLHPNEEEWKARRAKAAAATSPAPPAPSSPPPDSSAGWAAGKDNPDFIMHMKTGDTPSAASSAPAVGYGPGASAANNPESPGSEAARREAEAAGPSAPASDLTKLAVGAALSGVKAPAPPNPLPGAGAHAPGSGAIPQTTADDVLRSLAVILQSRHKPTLKEAV